MSGRAPQANFLHAGPRKRFSHRIVMIELHALSRSMSMGGQELVILHPLSLTIPRGQFVAVMGPSGSGKSTLLGLMAGLDAPSGGRIAIAGHAITGMNEDQLARFRGRHIGFVFQSFQLIPTLTAQENVQVPLEILREPGAAARAAELLAQVGLSGRALHYPAQLSGGEQQRVAIARAFACRPPVLLADEPTGNLDSQTGAQIIALLQRLHREEGATLVLVTHDPEIARAAERTIQLRDGRVVHDSAPAAPGLRAPSVAAG
jgi:putative ABC transport system ATP-binding protein